MSTGGGSGRASRDRRGTRRRNVGGLPRLADCGVDDGHCVIYLQNSVECYLVAGADAVCLFE